jgi:hypothetical protein
MDMKIEMEKSAVLVKKSIEEALTSNQGLLVGRWGTIEFEMIWFGHHRLLDAYQEKRYVLERNAGVFPLTKKQDVEQWVEEYVKAIRKADILATGWYAPMKKAEQQFLDYIKWKENQIVLRGLEPYYVDPEIRWTNMLKGRRVCVVTSFVETAKQQVLKGAKMIWGEKGESIWPSDVSWSWVQTGYAPVLAQGVCTWSEISGEDIQSWKEAVQHVVSEVMKTNAEIVLIGCGGLGMLIGSELKGLGKVCVVMGGATQVFLGIKGHRWETHDFISKLWNEEWVYPSDIETPGGAREVEGGCYW